MDARVGVVLVSHSAGLADGLRDLLAQLGGGAVTVLPAAGTADGGLGTSYELIAGAVRAADGGAGVVLLADLGSSVLTARTVLEDEPGEGRVLVDAPLVEGAVAAVVAASTGAALAEVVAAAEAAREFRKF
ncbi:dihydroxyacetone kinase phosphoryl donor subunit DhaM [Kitasatospora sp. NPDC094015]|uniref:dihydroxyacetone kinase phosphoryl donor subunit DhaM n=1 Tax=Kitasatospora sp. NPDC094015 TaxID=3155205 RepID=UPI00331E4CD5